MATQDKYFRRLTEDELLDYLADLRESGKVGAEVFVCDYVCCRAYAPKLEMIRHSPNCPEVCRGR